MSVSQFASQGLEFHNTGPPAPSAEDAVLLGKLGLTGEQLRFCSEEELSVLVEGAFQDEDEGERIRIRVKLRACRNSMGKREEFRGSGRDPDRTSRREQDRSWSGGQEQGSGRERGESELLVACRKEPASGKRVNLTGLLPGGRQYRGFADDRSVRQFLQQLAIVCEREQLSAQSCYRLLGATVEQRISEEMALHLRRMGIHASGDPAERLAAAEAFLLRQYAATNSVLRVESKLMALKQGRAEPVDSYMGRFKDVELENLLVGVEWPQGYRLMVFKRGLSVAYRKYSDDRPEVGTLELLVEQLRSWETCWVAREGSLPGGAKPVEGGFAVATDQRDKSKSICRIFAAGKLCRFGEACKFEHVKNAEKRRSCYRCGEVGHFVKDCPERGNEATGVRAPQAHVAAPAVDEPIKSEEAEGLVAVGTCLLAAVEPMRPEEVIGDVVGEAGRGQFTAPVLITGQECCGLLDTGSTWTLISSSLCRSLGLEIEPTRLPRNIRFGDGKLTASVGKVVLFGKDFQVDGCKSGIELLVIPNLRPSLVIGQNFLQRYPKPLIQRLTTGYGDADGTAKEGEALAAPEGKAQKEEDMKSEEEEFKTLEGDPVSQGKRDQVSAGSQHWVERREDGGYRMRMPYFEDAKLLPWREGRQNYQGPNKLILDHCVRHMEQQGWIEKAPVTSSGIVQRLLLVDKQDKKPRQYPLPEEEQGLKRYRVVLNARPANALVMRPEGVLEIDEQQLTKPHAPPQGQDACLELVESVPLPDRGFYATVDLESAFYGCELAPKLRRLFQFMHGSQLYQFRSLCMGWRYAPTLFQAAMEDLAERVRTRLPPRVHLRVKQDDSLLVGPALEAVQSAQKELRNELEKAQFKVNTEKTRAPSTSATFVGFRLHPDGGISPAAKGEAKVNQAVIQATLETLDTATSPAVLSKILRSWQGIVLYHSRWISTDVRRRLFEVSNLVSGAQKGEVTAEEARGPLKALLEVFLAWLLEGNARLYNDSGSKNSPTVVVVDGNQDGWCALVLKGYNNEELIKARSPWETHTILSKLGIEGIVLPVRADGAKWPCNIRKYSSTARERIALLSAVRRNVDVISNRVFIVTDSQNSLKQWRTLDDLPASLIPTWEMLQSWQAQVVHVVRKHALMMWVDASARRLVELENAMGKNDEEPIMLGVEKSSTKEVGECAVKRDREEGGEAEAAAGKRGRVGDTTLMDKLRRLHRLGHGGIGTLTQLARAHGLEQELHNSGQGEELKKKILAECKGCLAGKTSLRRIPSGHTPDEAVYVDTCVLVPSSFGLLVFVNGSSGHVYARLCSRCPSGPEVTGVFLDYWGWAGFPAIMQFDHQRCFSAELKGLMEHHGISCSRSPIFRAEANGRVERQVYVIKEGIRSVFWNSADPDLSGDDLTARLDAELPKILPGVLFRINMAKGSGTLPPYPALVDGERDEGRCLRADFAVGDRVLCRTTETTRGLGNQFSRAGRVDSIVGDHTYVVSFPDSLHRPLTVRGDRLKRDPSYDVQDETSESHFESQLVQSARRVDGPITRSKLKERLLTQPRF